MALSAPSTSRKDTRVVPLATAMAILGHSNPATTMRIYTHTALDEKTAAAGRVGDALWGVD
jgi:integrase